MSEQAAEKTEATSADPQPMWTEPRLGWDGADDIVDDEEEERLQAVGEEPPC